MLNRWQWIEADEVWHKYNFDVTVKVLVNLTDSDMEICGWDAYDILGVGVVVFIAIYVAFDFTWRSSFRSKGINKSSNQFRKE